MEQESVPFGINGLVAVIDTCHLSGCYKDQCAFLVIVLVAPVCQLPMNFFFQVDSVETIILFLVLEYLDIFEINE